MMMQQQQQRQYQQQQQQQQYMSRSTSQSQYPQPPNGYGQGYGGQTGQAGGQMGDPRRSQSTVAYPSAGQQSAPAAGHPSGRISQGTRCYRAMYDYESQDADEVSFRDGDIVINAAFIDEGWMTGTVHRTGQSGMLPANYVEPVTL